jgi:hypothetical protein
MRDGKDPLRFGMAVLLFTLAGCGELPGTELLGTLEVGTPKAEILALLPEGGIVPANEMEAPQLLQGYWHERYFVEGQTIEVLWLHDVENGYPEDEFRRNLNPVIFRDDLLDGWGWEHFDLRREEWLLVEREPALEGVSIPTDAVPFILPEPLEAIPADSAPIIVPRGDGGGTGKAA